MGVTVEILVKRVTKLEGELRDSREQSVKRDNSVAALTERVHVLEKEGRQQVLNSHHHYADNIHT